MATFAQNYPNGFPGGVTRVHGDADGVVNVDVGLNQAGQGLNSNATIIATGLTKHPTAYRIVANVSMDTDMGEGGVVETYLRRLQTASTVVMYQVDGVALSVLVEAQGFGSDANVLAALNAAGNTNINGNTSLASVTISSVDSSKGFKISAS